jgi:ssDNA thymidine ADP-ribosyltransferase DarT-like protein
VSPPPPNPKIYHITHVDNLPGILADGCLVSDAAMVARGGPAAAIGMSAIKKRRVEELHVGCHAGTKVADYVPFYFCPRSIMLFVIHCANHPELTYFGGQGPIVHLEADLHSVIAWAQANGVRWAFSLSNAGSYYAQIRSQANELDQLDWAAIAATDFRSAIVKEGKQAEFLLYGSFPWTLVTNIGVCSAGIRARVVTAMQGIGHRPAVQIQPNWYY